MGSYLYIGPTGKVSQCGRAGDFEILSYGDIQNQTFKELLNNPLEKDSLYWKVLSLCNREVISKQDIIEYLNYGSHVVEDTIKELFDDFLIYANEDLSEIVSLINTNLINQ